LYRGETLKKFSTKLNGYDKTEVNSFVNEVAKNYEEILNSLKERDKKISDLTEKLSYYANLESTLNKAIFVAEDASTQIKRIARDESVAIVEEAKKNASRIINNALIKAEKTESDSENLQRKINIYKRRIKQILEEQISLIEEIDDIDM